jgi:hypothetical protein
MTYLTKIDAGLSAMAMAVAVTSEAFAVFAAASAQTITAAALHIVSAVSAALATIAISRTRGLVLEPRSCAVAATLVLGMPVLGLVGLFFVMLLVWKKLRPEQTGGVIEIAMRDFATERVDIGKSTVFEPLGQVLTNAVAVTRRMKAVMQLRRMSTREALPLLRLALGDKDEDVRLLSFAILERREKGLRRRIDAALARLDNSASTAGSRLCTEERALLERGLAQDYWELIYSGFVNGAIADTVLDRAAVHAYSAFTLRADSGTALLLGRIELRRARPFQACKALLRAEKLGIAAATTAPLFAEAAFLMRRFRHIPALLARAGNAQLRKPGLDAVAAYWLSSCAQEGGP